MATAQLDCLVKLSDLKTNIVQDFQAHSVVFLHYDDVFDAFTLMMVPPDTDTIVHYIDDNVGLLYNPQNMEVVGFQIEAFEADFIPKHDNVNKVWSWELGSETKDFGKVVFEIGRMKPQIVQEVVSASQPLFNTRGFQHNFLNPVLNPRRIFADF